MNLSTIPVAPHAVGYIKVACDDDPLFGEPRTRNEFIITQRVHEKPEEGQPKLATHPVTQKLLGSAAGQGEATKITEIPIRLFFNKASNALSIRYQAYSTPGNIPVCTGDGKDAKRLERAADNTQTIRQTACPGPELCDFVASGKAMCRRQVRMAVHIRGHDDPLSVFEVRSSSLNTYRALKAQLQLIEKRFAGLRHVPLKLALWQASNEASTHEPFSLMRLQLDAKSEVEAMQTAKNVRKELVDAGLDDDVDALVEPQSDGDAFVGAGLDFQAVAEFYEPVTRRAGAAAVTPSTVASHHRVAAGGFASAFIEAALNRSKPATSQEGEPVAPEEA